ncbi:hypothetical protein HFD88_008897 [Aspergillus terreus]|nr:hypothetical protein HFD88_008897 [Aspergillus terreus]
MSSEDSLLSELCTICHINAPKYRCPRCSTRTCSLPCSRRHKLWSQCSGIRDPAAYLRRSELATESAFDRDFNFITGIERGLERAERDVENRGIRGRTGVLDPAAVGLEHEVESYESGPGDKKRKRGPGAEAPGLVKGEAGFLRGAENAGVRVVRAPRGMSRNKANATRWHPKHKCLNWTVEWIGPEAYDRAFPLPKQEREQTVSETEPQVQDESAPPSTSTNVQNTAPDAEDAQPNRTSTPPDRISSHRDLYFYLHRPRTATKQPVVIPVDPQATLASALRDRTVLEFPSIYVLPDSPETLRTTTENPSFLLEEVYLQSQPQAEQEQDDTTAEDTAEGTHALGSVDITNVDENKVLEVLKKDLFEPVSAAATP